MSEINILTSQNVNVKYALAGVGLRIVAYAIDIIVFFALGTTISIIGALAESKELVLILIISTSLYPLLMEIFFGGQTLGKMAFGIRVVKIDGTKPGISSYILRWVFSLIDIAISMGGLATTLIAFSKNSQRLGDMAAGTTVVKVSSQTRLSQISRPQLKADYIPIFTEVNLLSEYDISLVKKVVRKSYENKDIELNAKMARHIKNKMNIESDLVDSKFLITILADYEYYALQDKALM